MNVNSPSAVGRHFPNQNNRSSTESGLVPVLLRIKAVPENIDGRFDALCSYALVAMFARRRRRRGRRRRQYASASYTASHVDHEKGNAWVS